MHPDDAGNVSSVPAFLSDGTVLAAGWAVPSEPVTIYWSNTPGSACRTGTPYVRSKITMRVHGVAFWQAGTSNLYAIDGFSPVDNVMISSISTGAGLCSFPNALYDDLVSLDPTPVDSYNINLTFPWTITTL